MQEYDRLKAEWAKRRRLICSWYKGGLSVRRIAAKLNLSTQRVHKIVKEADGK